MMTKSPGLTRCTSGPTASTMPMASPDYLASRAAPTKPEDLLSHRCINLRLPTYGGRHVWEFERRGRTLNAHIEGQLTFNTTSPIVEATLDGRDIAFLPEDEFSPQLEQGRRVRLLEDRCWKRCD